MSIAYDFSTTGPGTFTIDPAPRFRVVGLDGSAKTHVADTRSVSVTVTDGVSKREVDLEKRSIVVCNDDSKNKYLLEGLAEGKSMVSIAWSYIQTLGGNDPVYKDYFGSNAVETVSDNLSAILNDRLLSMKFVCGIGDSPDHCPSGIGGYLYDNTFYTCPLFFTASYAAEELCKGSPVDEHSVRGGAFISQLAYALMKAQNIKGACSDSRDLPDEKKLINAGSYEVRLIPLVVYLVLAY